VQSPFSHGGAEMHVRRLTEELSRRGVEADLVTLPLIERERFDLVRSALVWRMLDLTEVGARPVDAVIATRFPSYAARHPTKVVWLIHQYRQAYDQFGSPFSDLTASPEDRRTREAIAEIDRVGLTEARKVFANSRTVAERLRKHNGIASQPLYHPPPLAGRYRSGAFGDYALSVGRFDAWKRTDLIVRALASAPSARLTLVGRGPEEDRLRRLAADLRLGDRIRFVADASDEELLDLYAGARLVAVAPSGEDLGYVPLEAFLSGKPVLTTEDSGGPLEFVRDGETGLVVPARAEALGAALEAAWNRVEALQRMGEAGRRRAGALSWDEAVDALLSAAGIALP
jgi:glycosyltransferase involved in cell wall biosynthesis